MSECMNSLCFYITLFQNEFNISQLGISGYNNKLHVLLDKIMEKMTNFKIDPKRYEILKENVSILVDILYIFIKMLLYKLPKSKEHLNLAPAARCGHLKRRIYPKYKLKQFK